MKKRNKKEHSGFGGKREKGDPTRGEETLILPGYGKITIPKSASAKIQFNDSDFTKKGMNEAKIEWVASRCRKLYLNSSKRIVNAVYFWEIGDSIKKVETDLIDTKGKKRFRSRSELLSFLANHFKTIGVNLGRNTLRAAYRLQENFSREFLEKYDISWSSAYEIAQDTFSCDHSRIELTKEIITIYSDVVKTSKDIRTIIRMWKIAPNPNSKNIIRSLSRTLNILKSLVQEDEELEMQNAANKQKILELVGSYFVKREKIPRKTEALKILKKTNSCLYKLGKENIRKWELRLNRFIELIEEK